MKRFLANILIFISIVSAVTICVNYAYIKLNKADPDNTEKFNDVPASITVCNLGSSHGLYGFNYEDVTDEECFNFALTSQYLSYDLRLFDHYKNHINEGAVVFIPVSYFSLFGNDERTYDSFAEKNKRYYRILPSDMIKDYDSKTNIYVNYLPSLSAGVNLIKFMLGKSENTNDESWSKVATDIDVKEDAKAAYERHIAKRLDENGNHIINQEEVDSLKSMIEICQEIGATPILITTPYLKEYTDEIKENNRDFYEDFYAMVNDIVCEMNVEYFDYSFDERFINNYNWFMNSDHLNKEGARQFVNILMDEVVHYDSPESLLKD